MSFFHAYFLDTESVTRQSDGLLFYPQTVRCREDKDMLCDAETEDEQVTENLVDCAASARLEEDIARREEERAIARKSGRARRSRSEVARILVFKVGRQVKRNGVMSSRNQMKNLFSALRSVLAVWLANEHRI